MTPLTSSLVMLGALLDAAARLLLKAGTNRVDGFAFARGTGCIGAGVFLVARP